MQTFKKLDISLIITLGKITMSTIDRFICTNISIENKLNMRKFLTIVGIELLSSELNYHI